MKFTITFSLILILLCSWIKKEKNNDLNKSFKDALSEIDSIDCWTTQYHSSYDLKSNEFEMGLSNYGGLFIMSNDSIFNFGCKKGLTSAKGFEIKNNKLIIEKCNASPVNGI